MPDPANVVQLKPWRDGPDDAFIERPVRPFHGAPDALITVPLRVPRPGPEPTAAPSFGAVNPPFHAFAQLAHLGGAHAARLVPLNRSGGPSAGPYAPGQPIQMPRGYSRTRRQSPGRSPWGSGVTLAGASTAST